MNCLEIPAILISEPSSTRCERLAAAKPNCQCEGETVAPDLSPGSVQDGEMLARFVHPSYLEDGKVTPAAFAHAGNLGMSVTRLDHASREDLTLQQASKGFIGYVVGRTSDIRSLIFEGSRTFCVYDTALSTNQAHADICQNLFKPKSKTSEMRRSLHKTFTRLPVSAAC